MRLSALKVKDEDACLRTYLDNNEMLPPNSVLYLFLPYTVVGESNEVFWSYPEAGEICFLLVLSVMSATCSETYLSISFSLVSSSTFIFDFSLN